MRLRKCLMATRINFSGPSFMMEDQPRPKRKLTREGGKKFQWTIASRTPILKERTRRIKNRELREPPPNLNKLAIICFS
jgi:hypothetical protein